MGSYFELNDTLQITTKQGFPADILDIEKHQKNPISINEVKNKIFEFHNKPNARIYHMPPCRCFLAHNINGKWLYWGKIVIIEQTIHSDNPNKLSTSGKYKITEIYDPIYQKQFTIRETSIGKSYFE
ncbi:MAG: hypothetical protein ACD_58C00131G0008 [uncultured bacterium]|nr:MAG: hypothetical protein ACD_58C00131G0008 [uncultured bacterium]